MKDSSADWIGAIPVDWGTRKNKYLFDIVKRIAGKEGYDVLAVTQQGLKVKDVESGEGQLAKDYSGYQFVYPGDFVMNHMDLLTGWVDCSELSGVTSPDYRVFKPKLKAPVNREYFKYIFQYCYANRVFYNLGRGVAGVGRWRLQADAFNSFIMPLPTIEEQQRIADYLDARCREIDAVKQTLFDEIEALQRLRKATIHKAVTKGLDENVPMKDSGVDWIGDIPEEWDVVPLKSDCTFGKGVQYNKADLLDDGFRIISYGQVHSKDNKGTGLIDELFRYADENVALRNRRSIVRSGCFLFAATSEDAESLGNCVLVDEDIEVLAGTDTVIVRDFRECHPKYLAYLFLTDCWRDQFRRDAIEVKVYHLSATKLRRTSILKPPFEQQQRIADYLDERCAAIDSVIETRTKQLERLEDYRKALVFAYVTGKKEVPVA